MILFVYSKQHENVKHLNKCKGNILFIFTINYYTKIKINVVDIILFIHSKLYENVKHLNKFKGNI